MSTYKNLLNAARVHFSSSPFLRVLLSAHLAVFIFGAVAYLLGAFLINLQAMSCLSWYDSLTSVGIVFVLIGLVLSVIADDAMGVVIVSSVLSVGALVAWIVILVSDNIVKYYGAFFFGPLFYFLIFGTIAVVTGIKSDRFKQMRAAAAMRAQQMSVMPCPKCGALVPIAAPFCPACGAQKPMMQYAPPMYQAPQPQYAVPVQPQYAPQAAPMAPPAPPVQPEAAAPKCVGCGADLPVGAAFCAKCGARQ